MVARDLLLLEETGGRYHVAHLSTARSLELVRRAKAAGLRATCEVTPHHLLLTDREIAERGFSTDCKMKPPLRSESDREALLLGVVDGTVDVIASDHAPHLADEKELQFSVAPFGIVGLESTLPLCLDRLVRPRAITLSRLVDLLSTAPARLLGIPGGSLAPGCVADVTAFSLDRQVTIRPDRFKSKGRSTPFDGWKLRGRPVATFLAGRRVTV
jgi:dihydroorotase